MLAQPRFQKDLFAPAGQIEPPDPAAKPYAKKIPFQHIKPPVRPDIRACDQKRAPPREAERLVPDAIAQPENGNGCVAPPDRSGMV